MGNHHTLMTTTLMNNHTLMNQKDQNGSIIYVLPLCHCSFNLAYDGSYHSWNLGAFFTKRYLKKYIFENKMLPTLLQFY